MNDQMIQNRQVLAGKVRETIDVEGMIFRKITHLHLLQQHRRLISGVSLTTGTEGIVTFQNQRQFLQFLGQAALRFRGSIHEILGRNAAPFKLIHRIDHAGEKFRFGFHGSIGFQLTVKLGGCCSHSHDAATFIQAFFHAQFQVFRNPPCQTGKG